MSRAVVYLRLPGPRDGFKDPDVANWTAEKEKKLLAVLREGRSDLKWELLAKQFEVPITYILQQAAWLYQKELDTVKRNMSQFATKSSPPRSLTQSVHSQRTLPSDQSSFLDQSDDSFVTDYPSRRLLAASRIESTDEDTSIGDSSLDAFLPPPETSEPYPPQSNTSSSDEGDDGLVSRSALEAALMDRLYEGDDDG